MYGKKVKLRAFFIFLIFLSVALSVFLVFKALEENVVYFKSPTEVKNLPELETKKIRVGGMVKKNSIIANDSEINFIITDFKNELVVSFKGSVPNLFEDSKGLGFVSQMGRSTKGQDAFLDYQDGILREHSIGFNYLGDKMKFVEDSPLHKEGHWEINEVKLWEGSGVTFGANSLTPVIDAAKGLKDNSYTLKKLNELTITLEGALKNGKGTDERLVNIEQMFAQLKQLHNSLELNKPSSKDTLELEPKKSVLDYLLNT